MIEVSALSPKQQQVIDAYKSGYNLLLTGSPKTGKTFLGLSLGLRDVENGKKEFLLIVRSAKATVDIGFLPGSQEEKMAAYEEPYEGIVSSLFHNRDTYRNLKNKGLIEFRPTSFLRGTTFSDCVILIDEAQNCTYHELATVLTRVGNNSRVIISGDLRQCDLTGKEKSGFSEIMDVLNFMSSFSRFDFTREDIVGSEFVKEFLTAEDQFREGFPNEGATLRKLSFLRESKK